jgi:hypothetical protein
MKVIATLYVLFLCNFCLYCMWQIHNIWYRSGSIETLAQILMIVLGLVAVLSVGVLLCLVM